MKNIILSSLVSLLIILLISPTAFAAKPTTVSTTKTPLGIDVSYPQCGKTLPTTQAFGVVGVNGGNAATTNECLSDQLVWASKSSGAITSQPKIQLYVNTANPGEVIYLAKSWPTTNKDRTGIVTDNPYGDDCTGGNTLSCSWQYGWDRALEAVVDRFTPAALSAKVSAAPNDYIWWLDVETMNTWQSGSADALKRNVAALEGMTSYYKSISITSVGIYSTAFQWAEITGNHIETGSNLNGLINWRPGGATLNTAKQACVAKSLTAGGRVVMTQFISKNLDYNYSCI